ncbi:GNAT family N-acetyltransferase [Desulforhopalus singaporensis]|uniref:N-acetylglutamate synthase, GNAT family n=1 Tax=Desulforhopalus singaporensis TaxID=91360 RepID=A0A1H0S732_9BACT|nr:GNAT family N-acetyltransferase [Desulforhopalus singaporensis]SDP37520.1 N-acetylglutamate synthase, GNAT family [Desulforhopalus singaporensis]
MPQLYLDEYSKNLVGRRVCIACREGILRDNFSGIVADIKFLRRYGIKTTLFHNLPNRFANRKLLIKMDKRLPETRIVRIAADVDFYQAVLASDDIAFKLIFLERRYLIDDKGLKINSLTTGRARSSMAEFGELVANVNFRAALNQICEKIENGCCERVHILPAGKNSIKHELFTIEGSGTMIANNFAEEFRRVKSDEDVAIVNRILAMYKSAGYLKPRSKNYVSENKHRFYVTAIDGIIVGCVEQKPVDEKTVELGALAISTRFRNQRIGVFTVSAFIDRMQEQGYRRFISLTRNPRLQALFAKVGFVPIETDEFVARQKISPGVPMYIKIV